MRHCGIPRLVIAAPQGRSGKTITTIGLLSALKKAGCRVQPYKKGPDFIDPSWMTRITGRFCRNLDSFLMDRETIRASLARTAGDADLVVVEGAMGLFDGVDLEGSGSTAEIAKAIGAPVILVVDTTRMTRSVAAMVSGYRHFDPEVRVAGVILNKVARPRHEQMLRAAIRHYCGIPVLGVIPKGQKLNIPDRHLGLVPALESDEQALTVDGEVQRQRLRVLNLTSDLKLSLPIPTLRGLVNPERSACVIRSHRHPVDRGMARYTAGTK